MPLFNPPAWSEVESATVHPCCRALQNNSHHPSIAAGRPVWIHVSDRAHQQCLIKALQVHIVLAAPAVQLQLLGVQGHQVVWERAQHDMRELNRAHVQPNCNALPSLAVVLHPRGATAANSVGCESQPAHRTWHIHMNKTAWVNMRHTHGSTAQQHGSDRAAPPSLMSMLLLLAALGPAAAHCWWLPSVCCMPRCTSQAVPAGDSASSCC